MTFEEAIFSGGDERIELKSNGLNKYYVNPLDFKGSFSRGSCTCSHLSDDVKPKVKAVFNRISTGEASLEDVRVKQRFRMKALLQDSASEDFNIFFAPSGTDLCYYPILLAKIKDPVKPIMVLITCPEELGTGSLLANSGHFFSEKTQISEAVKKGAKISESLNIGLELFPARSNDGLIVDNKQNIYDSIKKYEHTHQVIVHLVIGSKSGIEDNISIIEDGPKNVTYVVDLCQMRATPKLFNELLDKNCILMITGSKFYQSPPFCGALLVPESMAESILNKDLTQVDITGFDQIYSKYDIPPCYEELRDKFSDFENMGLTLRWEAAICESELLANYSEREVTYAISSWNKHVIEYLNRNEYFELMYDQDKTNRSIISFRIIKQGQYLNNAQLKQIYDRLLIHGHEYQSKFKTLTTGQPVEYVNHSFLRFALGSRNVRALIDNGYNFENDDLLIDVITKIIDEFTF